MSGRRRGRPTKGADELTQREADTLAQIESRPDGSAVREIAAALGVQRASAETWLRELQRRDLAHSFLPEGATGHTPRLWLAGPASTGPALSPLLTRQIPSIFHAGAVCT